jgi:hypothetical protein
MAVKKLKTDPLNLQNGIAYDHLAGPLPFSFQSAQDNPGHPSAYDETDGFEHMNKPPFLTVLSIFKCNLVTTRQQRIQFSGRYPGTLHLKADR